MDQNTGADTVDIQFDASWENSWRDATNYDAVWVFAKYCTENCSTTGAWKHATLKTSGTNPTGFSRGTGTTLDIVVPSDKKGAFLQRSANGTGSVSTSDIEFVWDYGTDGVSDNDAVGANTRVRVFGIEMVYVPEGDFYAGDGSSAAGFTASENVTPWHITNEAGYGDGYYSGAGSANYFSDWFWYVTGGNEGEDGSGAEFLLPTAFPKGYKAFYTMKYEISQGQYRDFLNSLSRSQQPFRVVANIASDSPENKYVMSNTATPGGRNSIAAPTSGNGTTNRIIFGCDLNNNGTFNESSDGEWIAMNYLTWMDVCAYADWAALRPMTELEFEKASRGAGVTPVAGEYVWGTTTKAPVTALVNSGSDNEASATLGANYNAEMVFSGPVRGGMFSTATSTREQAGAGYYGALDLSGNVSEQTVGVGNSAGRVFTGSHGDGVLGSIYASATNGDWPGYNPGNGCEVTGAAGAGERGGSYAYNVEEPPTSYRLRAVSSYAGRLGQCGGRAVRTAE
ncbi:MAG TPA: SUMF1/EgtB/PvdO family nonheme iron enzyme [Candidatus Omnitrophota bacterium]|nr:SUMF1/EgtB/PvdO family nonheme iron enzyme [Candidatus Omnitrophota bacterium]